MVSQILLLLSSIALNVSMVSSHSVIIGAQGIGGPQGRALGVDMSTPRDGTRRSPFQQDSSIIRDSEIEDGGSPCGRTLENDENTIQSGVAAMMAELGSLPEIAPGQPLTLTVHQVNADGAGPFTCECSQNGLGTDFQALQITQNVEGTRGRNRDNNTTPLPLTVMMPAGMQCTGGPNGNMCLVRCRNSVRAGPFGGCVPVQQGPGNQGAPAAGIPGAEAGAGNQGAVGAGAPPSGGAAAAQADDE